MSCAMSYAPGRTFHYALCYAPGYAMSYAMSYALSYALCHRHTGRSNARDRTPSFLKIGGLTTNLAFAPRYEHRYGQQTRETAPRYGPRYEHRYGILRYGALRYELQYLRWAH